jgi:hypothetical protein
LSFDLADLDQNEIRVPLHAPGFHPYRTVPATALGSYVAGARNPTTHTKELVP